MGGDFDTDDDAETITMDDGENIVGEITIDPADRDLYIDQDARSNK